MGLILRNIKGKFIQWDFHSRKIDMLKAFDSTDKSEINNTTTMKVMYSRIVKCKNKITKSVSKTIILSILWEFLSPVAA